MSASVGTVQCQKRHSSPTSSTVFSAKTGVDLLEQVDAWIVATRELDGQAEMHVRQAARWVRDWLQHVTQNAQEIGPGSCIDWLREMTKGNDLAPQTVRNRMSACRRFAGWLLVQGLIDANPWAHVQSPRGRAGQGRDAFTDADVAKLVAHAMHKSKIGFSPAARISALNRAHLYRFLSLTGVRRGEAHAQLWRDIDLDARTMVVSLDKARRRDQIPLSSAAVELLREMIPTRSGPKLFRKTVSYRGLEADLEAVGLKGRYGFHSFRCGYITESFENGTPAELIQRLVRHRDISQTHRYIRHREPRLREAAESRAENFEKLGTTKTSVADSFRTGSTMTTGAPNTANTSTTSASDAPVAVEPNSRAGLRCVRSRSAAKWALQDSNLCADSQAERLLEAALLLTQAGHREGALLLMRHAQLLLEQQGATDGQGDGTPAMGSDPRGLRNCDSGSLQRRTADGSDGRSAGGQSSPR
jgi:integrase